jgi:hypothetical protein
MTRVIGSCAGCHPRETAAAPDQAGMLHQLVGVQGLTQWRALGDQLMDMLLSFYQRQFEVHVVRPGG